MRSFPVKALLRSGIVGALAGALMVPVSGAGATPYLGEEMTTPGEGVSVVSMPGGFDIVVDTSTLGNNFEVEAGPGMDVAMSDGRIAIRGLAASQAATVTLNEVVDTGFDAEVVDTMDVTGVAMPFVANPYLGDPAVTNQSLVDVVVSWNPDVWETPGELRRWLQQRGGSVLVEYDTVLTGAAIRLPWGALADLSSVPGLIQVDGYRQGLLADGDFDAGDLASQSTRSTVIGDNNDTSNGAGVDGDVPWWLDRLDQVGQALDGQAVRAERGGAGEVITIIVPGTPNSDQVAGRFTHEQPIDLFTGDTEVDSSMQQWCDATATGLVAATAGDSTGVAPKAQVTAIEIPCAALAGQSAVPYLLAALDYSAADLNRIGHNVALMSMDFQQDWFTWPIHTSHTDDYVDASLLVNEALKATSTTDTLPVVSVAMGSFSRVGCPLSVEEESGWVTVAGTDRTDQPVFPRVGFWGHTHDCVDVFAPAPDAYGPALPLDQDLDMAGYDPIAASGLVAGFAAVIASEFPNPFPGETKSVIVGGAHHAVSLPDVNLIPGADGSVDLPAGVTFPWMRCTSEGQATQDPADAEDAPVTASQMRPRCQPVKKGKETPAEWTQNPSMNQSFTIEDYTAHQNARNTLQRGMLQRQQAQRNLFSNGNANQLGNQNGGLGHDPHTQRRLNTLNDEVIQNNPPVNNQGRDFRITRPSQTKTQQQLRQASQERIASRSIERGVLGNTVQRNVNEEQRRKEAQEKILQDLRRQNREAQNVASQYRGQSQERLQEEERRYQARQNPHFVTEQTQYDVIPNQPREVVRTLSRGRQIVRDTSSQQRSVHVCEVTGNGVLPNRLASPRSVFQSAQQQNFFTINRDEGRSPSQGRGDGVFRGSTVKYGQKFMQNNRKRMLSSLEGEVQPGLLLNTALIAPSPTNVTYRSDSPGDVELRITGPGDGFTSYEATSSDGQVDCVNGTLRVTGIPAGVTPQVTVTSRELGHYAGQRTITATPQQPDVPGVDVDVIPMSGGFDIHVPSGITPAPATYTLTGDLDGLRVSRNTTTNMFSIRGLPREGAATVVLTKARPDLQIALAQEVITGRALGVFAPTGDLIANPATADTPTTVRLGLHPDTSIDGVKEHLTTWGGSWNSVTSDGASAVVTVPRKHVPELGDIPVVMSVTTAPPTPSPGPFTLIPTLDVELAVGASDGTTTGAYTITPYLPDVTYRAVPVGDVPMGAKVSVEGNQVFLDEVTDGAFVAFEIQATRDGYTSLSGPMSVAFPYLDHHDHDSPVFGAVKVTKKKIITTIANYHPDVEYTVTATRGRVTVTNTGRVVVDELAPGTDVAVMMVARHNDFVVGSDSVLARTRDRRGHPTEELSATIISTTPTQLQAVIPGAPEGATIHTNVTAGSLTVSNPVGEGGVAVTWNQPATIERGDELALVTFTRAGDDPVAVPIMWSAPHSSGGTHTKALRDPNLDTSPEMDTYRAVIEVLNFRPTLTYTALSSFGSTRLEGRDVRVDGLLPGLDTTVAVMASQPGRAPSVSTVTIDTHQSWIAQKEGEAPLLGDVSGRKDTARIPIVNYDPTLTYAVPMTNTGSAHIDTTRGHVVIRRIPDNQRDIAVLVITQKRGQQLGAASTAQPRW